MAQRKKATPVETPTPGPPERPADTGQAGGRDDAAAGAQLAVRLLNRDLSRIGTQVAEKESALLGQEMGTLVALYARTLSAIERDRRKGSAGEFSGKTNEELLEMARSIPELRELLGSE